ncbi:MAG: type II toxin-antitoxin system VapC family toxin [Bacteroidota bacterium]
MTAPRVVYLLDTNVFREIQKGEAGHVNVRRWLAGVDDIDLRMSVMTIREVRRGIARLAKRKPTAAVEIERRFEELLAAYVGRVAEVDDEIAKEWGRLEGERDKHRVDLAFVATARIRGLVLATRNVRDVRGRGVRVLDPFKRSPKVEMV